MSELIHVLDAQGLRHPLLCKRVEKWVNSMIGEREWTIVHYIHRNIVLYLLSDINECNSSPCQNGATCNNTQPPGTYRCDCVPGYNGTNCEIGKSYHMVNSPHIAQKDTGFRSYIRDIRCRLWVKILMSICFKHRKDVYRSDVQVTCQLYIHLRCIQQARYSK